MPIRFDDIGNRLKAFRLGSGLSAEEIAQKLGISRTALYRFEKGELAKIETLENLAELLQVSVPTLLGVVEVRRGTEGPRRDFGTGLRIRLIEHPTLVSSAKPLMSGATMTKRQRPSDRRSPFSAIAGRDGDHSPKAPLSGRWHAIIVPPTSAGKNNHSPIACFAALRQTERRIPARGNTVQLTIY